MFPNIKKLFMLQLQCRVNTLMIKAQNMLESWSLCSWDLFKTQRRRKKHFNQNKFWEKKFSRKIVPHPDSLISTLDLKAQVNAAHVVNLRSRREKPPKKLQPPLYAKAHTQMNPKLRSNALSANASDIAADLPALYTTSIPLRLTICILPCLTHNTSPHAKWRPARQDPCRSFRTLFTQWHLTDLSPPASLLSLALLKAFSFDSCVPSLLRSLKLWHTICISVAEELFLWWQRLSP